MSLWPSQRALRRAVAWLRFVVQARRIGHFLAYAAKRFYFDGCLTAAGGLSYVSLLAIVPLFAVGLAVLSGFPAFEQVRADIQSFAFRYFLPDTGLAISESLTTFIDKASRMTGPGLIGLALSAVLLMANVNGALNNIWRATEVRPLAMRFMVYWVLLTLGPLLIGASVSVSSSAFANVSWSEVESVVAVRGLSRLLSIGLSALGFGVIYLVAPNRAVHLGHALAGGLVAGLLFEVLKAAFALYLQLFPTYQLVYGAVAAVPVFLVWMYLFWAVILFGAEVTAALPEWRTAHARQQVPTGPGATLALGLSLLARLRKASQTGETLRERALSRGLPATPAEVDLALRHLRRGGLIARTLGGRWVLARDLDTVTLAELTAALELSLAPGTGWHPAAEALARELAEVRGDLTTQSIARLLARFEGEEVKPWLRPAAG